MNKLLKVYLAVFIATLFWGFSFIWSKIVLSHLGPITTILFRLIISTILLYSISLFLNKIQKIDKNDWKTIFLLALFQPFLYFIGENIGLTYTSSTVAAVIIATIPLFSPLASYFFLKERIAIMNLFGILISIIGVFLVIIKPDLSFSVSPIGISLLLLAVFSAILYSVVVVKLAGKYNVYTLVTYQNAIGVLFFIPIFLIFEYNDFQKVPFNWAYIIPLIELAVFASSVAFVFFTYGIQNLGVTRANTIANIIPVFTAVFAYFINNERLSLINSMGIAFVIFGLFLSQIRKSNFQLLRRKSIEEMNEIADEVNSVR